MLFVAPLSLLGGYGSIEIPSAIDNQSHVVSPYPVMPPLLSPFIKFVFDYPRLSFQSVLSIVRDTMNNEIHEPMRSTLHMNKYRRIYNKTAKNKQTEA